MAQGASLAGVGAELPANLTGAPGADAIRAQVQRIAGSEGFARSERLKRFLGYIVEETLAGRGNQIKAYTIAMGVCDRDERFDSRLDPIVRIEAGRLRRALQHYYLTAGHADAVVIDMPKGGYHPSFGQRPVDPVVTGPVEPPPLAPPPRQPDTAWLALLWPWQRASLLRGAVIAAVVLILGGSWLHYEVRRPDVREIAAVVPPAPARPKMQLTRGPAVVLMPFENLSDDPLQEYFAQGLTEDLTRHLSRHADVSVRPSRIGFPIARNDREPASDPVPATFVIKGSVRRAIDKVRVAVQLYDPQSGAGLWAHTYDRIQSIENFVELQDEIARALVSSLVGPMGVITESMLARLNSGERAEEWGTYECTLRQYRFMRTWLASDHRALRECFERAVADYPDFGRGWGALAYAHLNEYRYGYDNGAGEKETLARAVAAARRAVELDRADIPSREALSIAYYYARDFTRSFEVSEALTDQYPTDPALNARIAARLAFAGIGRWDEGMARFYKAKASTPNPPGFFYLITALDAYRRGDDRLALREAERMDMTGFILRPMIMAMIYGQLGMQAEAQSALGEARRLVPRFVDEPQKWFARLTFDQLLFARMMEGLQKAGLKVHSPHEQADR